MRKVSPLRLKVEVLDRLAVGQILEHRPCSVEGTWTSDLSDVISEMNSRSAAAVKKHVDTITTRAYEMFIERNKASIKKFELQKRAREHVKRTVDVAMHGRNYRKVYGTTVHSGDVEELEKLQIPWLVPACRRPDQSCEWCEHYFKSLNIASLVPGATGSRCDVSAYKWPSTKEGEEPFVRFEVKARAVPYSLTEAMKDLVSKCNDHDCASGNHHAFLIGVRDQLKTEVKHWRVKKRDDYYWRVVVLIATKHAVTG